MGLKPISPEEPLYLAVKKLRRELDLAIQAYEASKSPDDYQPRPVTITDPRTGKTTEIKRK